MFFFNLALLVGTALCGLRDNSVTIRKDGKAWGSKGNVIWFSEDPSQAAMVELFAAYANSLDSRGKAHERISKSMEALNFDYGFNRKSFMENKADESDESNSFEYIKSVESLQSSSSESIRSSESIESIESPSPFQLPSPVVHFHSKVKAPAPIEETPSPKAQGSPKIDPFKSLSKKTFSR
jgi:hypothetical protein